MDENKVHKENFGSKLGRFVVQWKWLVLLASLALGIFLASGLQNAGFNNDYRVFFGKENPQLKAYDALQNKYTKDDNLYIVVEPKEGKVFQREVLLAIEAMVDSAWQTPYSSRVDALTNYQFTQAIGDDMFVDDLISDVQNKSDEDIQLAEKRALSESILMHRLINEDASLTGINIVIKKPEIEDFFAEQALKKKLADSLGLTIPTYTDPESEVAAYVRQFTKNIEAEFPGVKTHLSGVVMLSNAFAEAANTDLSTLIPAMYLVIIITLLILVLYNTKLLPGFGGTTRSIITAFSATFAAVMVLIFSITGGVGLLSTFGVQLTPVSVSAPTMILTLAVADSIHIIISVLQGMRSGLTKNEAIIESMRINFMPVFITSATTIIGFLTMNFSDSPPFHDLGNIAAAGVAIAFLLSVTLLIALLAILPMWVKVRPNMEGSNKTLLIKFADWVILRRRQIQYGFLLLTILFVYFASRNELNEQFVEYFDDKIEFRKATDFMADNLTGIYNIEYSVSAGEEGGISNPTYLKTLEEFENWFESNEKVVHVNTYTDVARKVNKSMHGDDPAQDRLPENREEAAQYLLLYEMSLPFGLDLNNQVNVDKSETRFTVTVDNITAKELIKLSEDGEQWLGEHGIQGESNLGISTAIMFAHLTQRQISNMSNGAIWAIILISLVLIIALRSFRLGLLSIIPNVMPIALGFGIWYFLSGQITSGLAIVFSITIGIVVDDTVHIFSKYLRARREQNKSVEDSIRYAFSTVGMAIITTSIVLSAGFFILGFSSFTMNSGMAKLSAITILLALVIDLLLLPPLLLAIDKRKE